MQYIALGINVVTTVKEKSVHLIVVGTNVVTTVKKDIGITKGDVHTNVMVKIAVNIVWGILVHLSARVMVVAHSALG